MRIIQTLKNKYIFDFSFNFEILKDIYIKY